MIIDAFKGINKHMIPCRAFLDDVEVSDICFYCDIDVGIVGLYVKNPDGGFLTDDDGVVTEYKTGKVRIEKIEGGTYED